MADSKISVLTSLTGANVDNSADVIEIVDTSVTTNKKITAAEFAIGMQTQTTWTPVLTFATAGDLNVVYSAQVGSYTKIGKLITLTCNIVTSTFTWSTASGNLQVTGLPVAAKTLTGYVAVGAISGAGILFTGSQITPAVASAASLITIASTSANGGSSFLTTANTTSGTQVTLNIVLQYESAT